MALKALTSEQLSQYHGEGYCLVQEVLGADDLASIRRVYETAAAEAKHGWRGWPLDETAWDGTSDRRRFLRRVPAPFYNDAGYREIFSSARVLDMVEDLIGPEIYLHSSMMLFKLAGVGRRMPPHQDQAYWDDLSETQVTLWCPTDPATPDSGCVELVPGSQQRGLLQHEDVDGIWVLPPSAFAATALRPVAMEPGDALFIHPLVVHTTGPNVGRRDRLAATSSSPRRSPM